jgi:hypothetical protein
MQPRLRRLRLRRRRRRLAQKWTAASRTRQSVWSEGLFFSRTLCFFFFLSYFLLILQFPI